VLQFAAFRELVLSYRGLLAMNVANVKPVRMSARLPFYRLNIMIQRERMKNLRNGGRGLSV
jgi:hypothetical protein